MPDLAGALPPPSSGRPGCPPCPSHHEHVDDLLDDGDLHDGLPMTCLEKTKLYMAKYADYFLEVSLQGKRHFSFLSMICDVHINGSSIKPVGFVQPVVWELPVVLEAVTGGYIFQHQMIH